MRKADACFGGRGVGDVDGESVVVVGEGEFAGVAEGFDVFDLPTRRVMF